MVDAIKRFVLQLIDALVILLAELLRTLYAVMLGVLARVRTVNVGQVLGVAKDATVRDFISLQPTGSSACDPN